MTLKNYASASLRGERLSPTSKETKKAANISLRKRAECHTEFKALQKSILARIIREPGLGLLDLSEMKKKQTLRNSGTTRVKTDLAGR